jgi:hypothetical protein
MSNKKPAVVFGAIIAGLILVVSIAAIIRYFISIHEVYIDLSDDVSSATIYHKSIDGEPSNKVTTIDTETSVSLKEVNYLAVVDGSNIDTSMPVEFTVASDTKSIEILPNLSKEYLKKLLEDDTVADLRHVLPETINEKINDNLGMPDQTNIAKGELVTDGSWYIGIITTTANVQRAKFDQYKIILHNAGDGWYVAADQAFVFRYDDFPEIPRDVIKLANRYEI